MIHSMSGGLIRDFGSFVFVKVQADGEASPRWYISDIELEEGDRVCVPLGRTGATVCATVLRIEQNVSGQVTPVPLKSAKKIIRKL
ncbi:MAG: hypothetical protein NC184_02585 [Roseburia sp.]|nr:hypothetical protein [Roseburia sp.]